MLQTQKIKEYILLVGSGRACAPVRCAHPSFRVNCHAKRGAARPPPSRPQKYLQSIELGPPTSRAFFFPLDPRGYEIWCPLAPAPLIVASLVLPAIFLGSNYVPMRPYALIFSVFSFFYSFWIFSFCYSLLFLLSFSISSYSSLLPSLLISSYSSYSRPSHRSFADPYGVINDI